LEARESSHSGQAKRDPESSIFEQFWIPAFAGMTEQVTFARSSDVFAKVFFWPQRLQRIQRIFFVFKKLSF
jgi:hypothetical protein